MAHHPQEPVPGRLQEPQIDRPDHSQAPAAFRVRAGEEAGAAAQDQLALPHDRQRKVIGLDHLPSSSGAHARRVLARKTRSTTLCPVLRAASRPPPHSTSRPPWSLICPGTPRPQPTLPGASARAPSSGGCRAWVAVAPSSSSPRIASNATFALNFAEDRVRFPVVGSALLRVDRADPPIRCPGTASASPAHR